MNHRTDCDLLGLDGLKRKATTYTETTNNSNSFSENISLWEDVVVLKGPSFVVL